MAGRPRRRACLLRPLGAIVACSYLIFHPGCGDFIREFYDPGWEETEAFTRRELGVDEPRNDGHHDDIWVTAMMAVTDPQQIRFAQRQAAGLASINGVALEPLDDTIALGKAMIEFRAAFTVEAIRRSLVKGD